MIDRLLKVLDRKLTEIETRMEEAHTEGAPHSAAELERDARSLTALARIYAKLVELDDEAKSGGQGSDSRPQQGATMRTNSAAILRSALSASTKQGTLSRFLSSLSAVELRKLHYDFELWARDDQLPPEAAQGGGAWTTWLMLGGRGAGKTRAGAEWVRASRQ